MLPWGHAALGYLLYSLWRRLRGSTPSSGTLVVALAFGTQFPDLVDKPLAWTFAILPSGRSLAHSLVVLVPLTLLYVSVQRRRANGDGGRTHPGSSTVGGAFLLGWYSHLLGDSWQVLVGWADCASFLLWPVTPLCQYDESSSVVTHLLEIQFSTTTKVGLVVTAMALGFWVMDGTPGLRSLRRRRT